MAGNGYGRDERMMNRRTALMQAVECWKYDKTLSIVDRATEFDKWLCGANQPENTPKNAPGCPTTASNGTGGSPAPTPEETLKTRFSTAQRALGGEAFYGILTKDFGYITVDEAIADGQADVVLKVMSDKYQELKKGGK